MLSIPIVARLLGGNGQSKRAQESFQQEVKKAAFRIDPSMRYYLLSDFHLEPDAPGEHAGLLRLLGRLLTEGGIGGVFLLGDVAARPGIHYDDLAKAHPKLFDTLYRLSLLTPVFLVLGECDLELDPPEFLRPLERFEDEHWILIHGYQFDPAVEVIRDEEDEEFLHVRRGQPDEAATLEGLRKLRQSSGKQIVFGHVHKAGYVEPGLTCLGHWTGGAADYAILRQGQVVLSRGRT
jgi:UDP-2,3-diacylglucosamine pyrophosphatase LpxH